MKAHLGFEQAWAPRMKSNYPKMAIVNLSTGIDLITVEGGEGGHAEGEHETEGHDHDHEGVDPHYWLSVQEAKTIARNMAHGLMKAEPACKQLIEQNMVNLHLRLDSLAMEMSTAFEGMTKKSFLIFHPALAYFARDYGMTQHSMEQAGKEPTASHFRELVDLARNEKINTIFIQKEYDQENATTFARETGATIVVIDPMSPDWMGEMRQLAVKIAAMEGR